MRGRLSFLAMAAAMVSAAGACDVPPTAVPAATEAPMPGGPPGVPDPQQLPLLPGQLVFFQGGEIVRWPPSGGRFQVVAAAPVVGALEVAASGSLLAYIEQNPEDSVRVGTVRVFDLTLDVPLPVADWPVGTADDFRLDDDDARGRRLAVSADGTAVAWFDGAPEPTVHVWTVGEPATFPAGACRATATEPRLGDSPACEAIQLSPDGDWVAFADVEGVKVVATASGGGDTLPSPSAGWQDGRLAFGVEGSERRGSPVAGYPVAVAEFQPDGPLVLYTAGGLLEDMFTAVLDRTDTGQRWDLSGLLYGGQFFRLAGAPARAAP